MEAFPVERYKERCMADERVVEDGDKAGERRWAEE